VSYELGIGIGVSGPVPSNLVRPILPVGPRGHVVLGASVPEAPVHEHCHLGGGEHEVGGAAHTGDGLSPHPVAKPRRWTAERTASSGRVSRDRLRSVP
jgi:hypothetical protein